MTFVALLGYLISGVWCAARQAPRRYRSYDACFFFAREGITATNLQCWGRGFYEVSKQATGCES